MSAIADMRWGPIFKRRACVARWVPAFAGTTTERWPMPRVVGVDHLVLSVGDFKRSKAFYAKLLRFLGFKLKYEYPDMAGWSNGKTLFWIGAADAQGKKHKYR